MFQLAGNILNETPDWASLMVYRLSCICEPQSVGHLYGSLLFTQSYIVANRTLAEHWLPPHVRYYARSGTGSHLPHPVIDLAVVTRRGAPGEVFAHAVAH